MSSEPRKALVPQALMEQLRQPFKLRIFLSLTILAAWYFLFYGPLGDQMAETQRRIGRERKRIAAARQIEELRNETLNAKDRLPAKADLNDLIQYVMARIRSSPLKLVDLKPDRVKSLGPYDTIALRLTCEGTYSEIDAFLIWIQQDRRLLRVDELNIAPARKAMNEPKASKTKLSIQLLLNSLVERTVAETPTS
jgi:Tfp pilus assembly protein PilO